MKQCTRCKVTLPLTAFDKDPHIKSGIRGACKACRHKEYKSWYLLNKDKAMKYSRLWHKANPEKIKMSLRKSEIKKKYKLTWEQYTSMLSSQNNKCAICSDLLIGSRKCCVDHDHKTKQNRDLLCPSCNKLIGFSRENPITLQRAIEYLNKWKQG